MILRKDSRDLKFHKSFGAISEFPLELDLDAHIINTVEGNGEVDCTAISCTEVATDHTKEIYDHDELWSRVPHGNLGADPRVTMGIMVKEGLQPLNSWMRKKPYSSYWRSDTGYLDSFDNVRSSMLLAKSTTTVATPWYREWIGLARESVMPMGKSIVSYHDYKISGWKQINGEPMLIIKWWSGYINYMPRNVFNSAMSVYGSSALMPSTAEIDAIRKKTLLEIIKDLLVNIILLTQQKQMTNADKLYQAAKNNLGRHLTLNPDIPKELGCAEAISFLLKSVGVPITKGGIAGSATLYEWLKENPAFEAINAPERGAIIISPTGYGTGNINGHTGILGGFSIMKFGDYGILSNDSNSGLFLELWTLSKWKQYYEKQAGIPTFYFRLK